MTKFTRFLMLFGMAIALAALAGCGPCGPQAEPAVAPTAASADAAGPSSSPLDDVIVALETSNIYFAFDRYDLDAAARKALESKADILKANPRINLKIEGHCDNRGTEEYNLALGERRAKAAYDYLVQLGVPADKLSTVSYGKLYPAAEGNTEEAWAMNRRDECRATVN